MKSLAKTLQKPARRKTASKGRSAGVRKTSARLKAADSGHWITDREFGRLQDTLREAQETLQAIRSGEVDAVVVSGARGNKIYSLAGAEQPYRVYVEQMQEGAVTVSSSGLILFCNQKFADMVQLPLERVIGSQLLKHLRPESWQTIASVFGGTGEVAKHECELLRRDESTVPVNLTANCLPQEEYKVMCLVVTDLTEQKKLEKTRLDKEVAEKASQAKDGFLAALSHELRTPLTPVLMTVAAMEQDRSLPQETLESLQLIRRNVELEARLIDDLLDLTRIASGKLELRLREMDFNALIQRALEISKADIAAKKHRLNLQLGAGQFVSEGDSVRIQQAICNLLSNAVKFTSAGGSISIRTRNSAENVFLFEIEDTGIGFNSENADKLFTAFEQGDRQITRNFGGLGLGLAIARSIIGAHGGTIRAASKGAGHGATFTFEIPLRKNHSVADKKGGAARRETGSAPSRKRILLVEDHEDTRRSLENLLRKNFYEVSSADSAEGALELAAGNQFDLVISDVRLPGQSGLELMSKLKYQFNLRGIGLSGYGMEEDIAQAHAAGFIQYLTKPVRFDQLKEIIEQAG